MYLFCVFLFTFVSAVLQVLLSVTCSLCLVLSVFFFFLAWRPFLVFSVYMCVVQYVFFVGVAVWGIFSVLVCLVCVVPSMKSQVSPMKNTSHGHDLLQVFSRLGCRCLDLHWVPSCWLHTTEYRSLSLILPLAFNSTLRAIQNLLNPNEGEKKKEKAGWINEWSNEIG